jgi:hypothetical protein
MVMLDGAKSDDPGLHAGLAHLDRLAVPGGPIAAPPPRHRHHYARDFAIVLFALAVIVLVWIALP